MHFSVCRVQLTPSQVMSISHKHILSVCNQTNSFCAQQSKHWTLSHGDHVLFACWRTQQCPAEHTVKVKANCEVYKVTFWFYLYPNISLLANIDELLAS